MGSEKVLYMIINPIHPYILDIYHMCALQKGLDGRTRWREKWMSDTLVKQTEKDIHKILLITFNPATDEYYPVRWATYRKHTEIGGIHRFDFILDDFVNINDTLSLAKDQVTSFSKYMKNKYQGFLGTKPDQRKAIFVGNDYTKVCSLIEEKSQALSEVQRWGNITQLLSGINEYSGKEFIKIVDFLTTSGESVSIVNGKYVLKDNTYYEIKVVQHIYESSAPITISQHEMKISCPPEHSDILKPIVSIVGKYDTFSFMIKTKDVKSNTNSYIDIDIDTGIKENTYDLQIPLQIEPAVRVSKIVSIGLAIVFAICLLFNGVWFNLPEQGLELLRILLIISTMSITDSRNLLITK